MTASALIDDVCRCTLCLAMPRADDRVVFCDLCSAREDSAEAQHCRLPGCALRPTAALVSATVIPFPVHEAASI